METRFLICRRLKLLITQRTPGCLKAAFTDTDVFALVFPPNSSAEDRALLMAATLFVDFRFFEKNPNNNNQNGGNQYTRLPW